MIENKEIPSNIAIRQQSPRIFLVLDSKRDVVATLFSLILIPFLLLLIYYSIQYQIPIECAYVLTIGIIVDSIICSVLVSKIIKTKKKVKIHG